MRYAFKLGPLETDEGRAYAYLAVGEDGHVHAPMFARGDRDGLQAIVDDAPPGERLLCEARLARAGAALGFEPAAMPAWALGPRGDLAAAIALGPEWVRGDREAMGIFFDGAAALWRGKPWRHWTDEDPIEVTLAGALDATFEAAVMGAARITYGVAIYPRVGARARIAAGAAREDTLAATFDAGPRFAVAALRDAYGLTRLPVPVKLEGGMRTPLDGVDLAILGGVMRTCAALAPARAEERTTVELDGRTVEVTARTLS